MSEGSLPGPWHGVISFDIGGDATTREEPDTDTTVDPLHGIDTTLIAIEGSAIAVIVVRVGESASRIVSVEDTTVCAEHLSGGNVGGGRATI